MIHGTSNTDAGVAVCVCCVAQAREIAGKHKGEFLESDLMPRRTKRATEMRAATAAAAAVVDAGPTGLDALFEVAAAELARAQGGAAAAAAAMAAVKNAGASPGDAAAAVAAVAAAAAAAARVREVAAAQTAAAVCRADASSAKVVAPAAATGDQTAAGRAVGHSAGLGGGGVVDGGDRGGSGDGGGGAGSGRSGGGAGSGTVSGGKFDTFAAAAAEVKVSIQVEGAAATIPQVEEGGAGGA